MIRLYAASTPVTTLRTLQFSHPEVSEFPTSPVPAANRHTSYSTEGTYAPHYGLHVCSLAIEATCSGPLGTCRQYKQAIVRDTSWWLIGEWTYSSTVFKVGSRWKRVVSFTPRPPGKEPLVSIRWSSNTFLIYRILPAAIRPTVYSVSNRNKY
jgi:hypothetical protein